MLGIPNRGGGFQDRALLINAIKINRFLLRMFRFVGWVGGSLQIGTLFGFLNSYEINPQEPISLGPPQINVHTMSAGPVVLICKSVI